MKSSKLKIITTGLVSVLLHGAVDNMAAQTTAPSYTITTNTNEGGFLNLVNQGKTSPNTPTYTLFNMNSLYGNMFSIWGYPQAGTSGLGYPNAGAGVARFDILDNGSFYFHGNTGAITAQISNSGSIYTPGQLTSAGFPTMNEGGSFSLSNPVKTGASTGATYTMFNMSALGSSPYKYEEKFSIWAYPANGSGGSERFSIYDDGHFNFKTLAGINAFTILNNGNVGIGTMTPGALLSIANGSSDPTNYGKGLQITNASGNSQQMSFVRAGNDVLSAGYYGASHIWGFGPGSAVDASFAPAYMAFDLANARIGIGAMAPAVKLEVNGADANGRVSIFRNGAYTSFMIANSGAQAWSPMVQTGDNGIVWNDGIGGITGNGFVIAPWSGSANGIRIDGPSGNVGVGAGATIPGQSKLTIGSASSSALSYGTSYIGFNTSRNSAGTWTNLTDGSHNGAVAMYGDINGNIRFLNFPNSATSTANSTLTDAQAINSTTMTIYAGGQVAIGGTQGSFNPPGVSTMLGIPGGYKLYVAGGILTEQVKVSLKTSANWADYVFADKYKLKPLTEVEQYVKANKHLPEVPSAQDVVKDGVNLVEMDATLLKKIEELTLYVIEQNKQISEQNKKIEALEQKQK